MNSYFASVECITRPELKDIPMVVAGDPKNRHGIILAGNLLAKQRGVITGESTFSALQKIPELKIIQPDYKKYVHYAKLSRSIYEEYAEEVIPYGLDEAWLILPNDVVNYDKAQEIANIIRNRIKEELKLTVSIGVSFNFIFSKLASDLKKPDATTVLSKDNLEGVIWKRPAFEMLFVGSATRKKLKNLGILTIGDLAKTDVNRLKKTLGKAGVNLWEYANGDDHSFNPRVPAGIPFKNISNSITTAHDLINEIDIISMLYVLTKVVVARIRKHSLITRTIGIKIKYYDFTLLNKQITIEHATDSEIEIYQNIKLLFFKSYNGNPIRSLGIYAGSLLEKKNYQMKLFIESEEFPDIKEVINYLKNKFGNFNVEEVTTNSEKLISIEDILKEE